MVIRFFLTFIFKQCVAAFIIISASMRNVSYLYQCKRTLLIHALLICFKYSRNVCVLNLVLHCPDVLLTFCAKNALTP